MNSKLRAPVCLLVLCLAGTIFAPGLPAWAQNEPVAGEPDEEAVADERDDGQDDAEDSTLSDAQLLLIRERVIELDQARLDEARLELESRQSFFDRLGQQTRDVSLLLEEKRGQRQGMDETADPADISLLEAEIAELEIQVEFMATQTDLTLTAESTVRKQIVALEKKLEREQRAIDTMRGMTPVEPVQAAEVPSAPPSEPARQVAPVPGLPVPLKKAAKPGSGQRTVTRLESTAQIEAFREVTRLEAEVARAELAVVEFVKRKESLQQQIGFEEVLRETAERSVENLSQATEIFTGLLQTKTEAGVGKEELEYYQEGIEDIEDLVAESKSEIARRSQYIESLQARLEQTQIEEAMVIREVENWRKEAKRALDKLYWLESPVHPKNLWRWISTRGPRMLLVVVVAWALLMLVRLSARGVARAVVGKTTDGQSRGAQRADTLALSVRSVTSLFIVVAAVLLVFQEAGVDIKTVLGGAAILGVALAFGAQNLMRDYFTGFMILLEDQYELGDLITVGGITGRVEKVNMRTTVLRDIEGRVHFIPNGEIKSVTNRTYVWGRAVLEIPVSYKEDVERVMEVIQQVAEEFREDPEVGEWVTEDPVMLGVDKFTESGVVIKFMVQTLPDKIFLTRRQMLRRIKNRFDREGIEISVPHRILILEKSDNVAT